MPEPEKIPILNVTSDELKQLARSAPNPERLPKTILFLVGAFLTPVTLAGALLGYMRGYNRFMKPHRELPKFSTSRPIVRVSMVFGGALIWLALVVLLWMFLSVLGFSLQASLAIVLIILANMIVSYFVYLWFRKWRVGVHNLALEANKYGTARFADSDELKEFEGVKGIYIGGAYTYPDKGHILTAAGTRGGKGTNLIIPNLLGLGGYEGSWVVIDPKGENAAITARLNWATGKNVVVINPWGLLEDRIGAPTSYNPLDILGDRTSIHLVDDVGIIAEMLVPKSSRETENSFFTDNARSMIAGLLLYLVTTEDKPPRKPEDPPETDEDIKYNEAKHPEKTLKTLWIWLRLSGKPWEDLITNMVTCVDKHYGLAVRTAGNEILKLMKSGDKTFGSIMASCLQCTSFLNSPSLQKSLQSGYNPAQLAEGNTTLYVIIPADKLQSHSRWLRLVVTSAMRAVVRKPKNRVTFLLDEFAALGYISEIETALSTYAGYNVTVWAILQSLVQLKKLYGENWESFTANTSVKQYFSVNDNFSADYISAAIGTTSHVSYHKTRFGGAEKIESNARALIQPDELRRHSGKNMFVFISDKPPVIIPKIPYYTMSALKDFYDDNPYINPGGQATTNTITQPIGSTEQPEQDNPIQTDLGENTHPEITNTPLSTSDLQALLQSQNTPTPEEPKPEPPTHPAKPRFRYNSQTGSFEEVL